MFLAEAALRYNPVEFRYQVDEEPRHEGWGGPEMPFSSLIPVLRVLCQMFLTATVNRTQAPALPLPFPPGFMILFVML